MPRKNRLRLMSRSSPFLVLLVHDIGGQIPYNFLIWCRADMRKTLAVRTKGRTTAIVSSSYERVLLCFVVFLRH
jgi:hypothetical protein